MTDTREDIRAAVRAAEAEAASESPKIADIPLSPGDSGGGRGSGNGTGDDGGDPGSGDGFSVEAINREFALVLLGSRAIVMQQNEEAPLDDQQRVLSVEAFQVWLGNRVVVVKGARPITWANAWLKSPWRRQYEGVEFYPDPNNQGGHARRLNLWKGFAFKPKSKPNGYKTLRDHLLVNVCGGDAKLFAWVFGFFAHIVQRPRERIGVAIVLRGGMGSGKTVVGEHFGALFPQHYFLVDDPRYVTGQFNAHMASCLLLQADEAVWAGDKGAEGRLKGLVTSPIQQIEAKGVDPIRLDNYVRLVMTSNESWVVPAGRDERRFCVLDVDPRCAQSSEYFSEMRAELRDGGYAALLHDLLAFDLASVDLRKIPKTEALLDQKERSLNSVSGWWLERLVSGDSLRKQSGWMREVPRNTLYQDYVDVSEVVGIRRRSEQTIFGRELHDLVPGLSGVRKVWRGGEGQERVRLYVLPSLAACRAAWDERMGQARVWPHEESDEGDADDG